MQLLSRKKIMIADVSLALHGKKVRKENMIVYVDADLLNNKIKNECASLDFV